MGLSVVLSVCGTRADLLRLSTCNIACTGAKWLFPQEGRQARTQCVPKAGLSTSDMGNEMAQNTTIAALTYSNSYKYDGYNVPSRPLS